MSCNISNSYTTGLLVIFSMFLSLQTISGQEANPELSSNGAYHNQLFFNRFLINPTFSLVRENKSYLNILHRNQYATFQDNSQNYFLGFSDRLNDNTALGIGVYSQWSGVVQEFGFNANYATSVQLGSKSKLTFGTNVTYFNTGLDKNRVIATENDPEILEANKESKIAIQPGITLTTGKFDFGLYAVDLFKYNQSTNTFLSRFDDKSIKASMQYTHSFNANRGLFENARLMPLLQVGKNEDDSMSYLGSVLLDLPNYGWLQTSLDDKYGLSMGLGFNLNKKMSLGYLMEKDITQEDADLGWNHELSLAYTFKNNDTNIGSLAENSQDSKIDRIVRNYEEQILQLIAENKKTKEEAKNIRKNKTDIRKNNVDERKNNVDDRKNKIDERKYNTIDGSSSLAYQNRLILDELILRQDSIEEARANDFEKRFETVVRVLRNDLKQNMKANLMEINRVQNTVLATNTKEVEISKSLNTVEHKDYVKLPIKVLDQSDIIGVKTGYYVIANVYSNKKYLNAFMNSLNEQGLDAKQFYNKENGLYYVYLADFNFKKDAEMAFVSNLDGKYQDEKWIMQVDDPTATVANYYED